MQADTQQGSKIGFDPQSSGAKQRSEFFWIGNNQHQLKVCWQKNGPPSPTQSMLAKKWSLWVIIRTWPNPWIIPTKHHRNTISKRTLCVCVYIYVCVCVCVYVFFRKKYTHFFPLLYTLARKHNYLWVFYGKFWLVGNLRVRIKEYFSCWVCVSYAALRLNIGFAHKA